MGVRAKERMVGDSYMLPPAMLTEMNDHLDTLRRSGRKISKSEFIRRAIRSALNEQANVDRRMSCRSV